MRDPFCGSFLKIGDRAQFWSNNKDMFNPYANVVVPTDLNKLYTRDAIFLATKPVVQQVP